MRPTSSSGEVLVGLKAAEHAAAGPLAFLDKGDMARVFHDVNVVAGLDLQPVAQFLGDSDLSLRAQQRHGDLFTVVLIKILPSFAISRRITQSEAAG